MSDNSIFDNIQSVLARIGEIKKTFGVKSAAFGRTRLESEFMDQLQQKLAPKTEQQAPPDVSVSAGLDADGRGVDGMGTGGAIPFKKIIQTAAERYKLPEPLIRAVIQQESGFDGSAVSRKGAMGLMQLMPETAGLLGVNDPFDVEENVLGGTRYLRELINLYGGNLNKALAAYNAGPNRVTDEIPNIPETKDYVRSVLDYYESFSKSQEKEEF
jgi:soluble lytic murein transglycosylase-like protein